MYVQYKDRCTHGNIVTKLHKAVLDPFGFPSSFSVLHNDSVFEESSVAAGVS